MDSSDFRLGTVDDVIRTAIRFLDEVVEPSTMSFGNDCSNVKTAIKKLKIFATELELERLKGE
jgi:hypothetical protein